MRRLRSRLHDLLVPTADGPQLVGAAPTVAIRELLRRFWPYARPYRGKLALGLLLAALVPAIETVEIYLFKLVVDDVLVPREFAPLLPLALAYLGLALLTAIISFGDEYVAAWVGERFLLRLRTEVFAHVQGLSSHSLDRRRLGDVLQRLTSDVQAIESFVLAGIGDGLSALLRILFFSAALFVIQWQLALVALVVTPLFFWVARHFSRLSKHAAREKRRRSGSLGAVAEESLANAALVQSLDRADAEVARFHAEGERIVEAELAATRIRGLFSPLVDLIELLGVLVVITLGTWALSQGELTLGGLLVFLAYLSQLYGPVRELGEPRQPDLRRRGGRRARARAARRAADGGRAARRGRARARARRGRAARRALPLPGRGARRGRRHRPGGAAGRDGRARRAERRGQVDARAAAAALRRPGRRARCARRARPARRSRSRACARTSGCCCRRRCCPT